MQSNQVHYGWIIVAAVLAIAAGVISFWQGQVTQRAWDESPVVSGIATARFHDGTVFVLRDKAHTGLTPDWKAIHRMMVRGESEAWHPIKGRLIIIAISPDPVPGAVMGCVARPLDKEGTGWKIKIDLSRHGERTTWSNVVSNSLSMKADAIHGLAISDVQDKMVERTSQGSFFTQP